jgi:hypothetical protein
MRAIPLLLIVLAGPVLAAEPSVSPAKTEQCSWERDTATALAEQARSYFAEVTFVTVLEPAAPPPPRKERYLALLAEAWANRDAEGWPMNVWTACLGRT